MNDLSRPALWLAPNGELFVGAIFQNGCFAFKVTNKGVKWDWCYPNGTSHLWSYWSEL
jgi:hypothetical protein